MGSVDRILRFIIAVVVGILFYMNVIEGTLGYVLIAAAGIFFLTSLISFCPLYPIFGLSTKKKE